MDKNGKTFSRPPPTSPARGPPRKKARREPPSQPKSWKPRDDADWASSRGSSHSGPISLRPSPSAPTARGQADYFRPGYDVVKDDDDDDTRESKPQQLGNYTIQPNPAAAAAPSGAELKIRGRSTVPHHAHHGHQTHQSHDPARHPQHQTEAGEDGPPAFEGYRAMFFSAMEGIPHHLEDIERAFVQVNLHHNHPAVRAVGRIRGQLNRVHESYQFLDNELDEAGRELAQFAARDDDFRKGLEEAGAVNFKLKCAKSDLAQEVEELRSAAGKAEKKAEELKRELEDLRGAHDRLLESHRDLHEKIGKEGAEKLLLEDGLRKRNGDLEEAIKESSRLQAVVEERDEDIRELKASGVELETLAEQRQREIAEAKEEHVRLQDLVREKEARISLLTTQPITPVSPSGHQGGPFSLPAGSACPMPRLEATQPSHARRETSPTPYIKQEASELVPMAAVALPPVAAATNEEPPDWARAVRCLTNGAAVVMGQAFSIRPHDIEGNKVLTHFLVNLGGALRDIRGAEPVEPSRWTLDEPWMVSSAGIVSFNPRLSVEVQVTQLCLLFPFPSTADDVCRRLNTDIVTFYLICSLLRNLTSQPPDARPSLGVKRAFVQGLLTYAQALELHMSTPTRLAIPLAPPTPRTVLLGIMLCELCRQWNEHFLFAFPPGHPGPDIDVAALLGQALLGQSRRQSIISQSFGLPHQQQTGCLGTLAGLLRQPFASDIGDTQTLRDRLAEECGDGFCVFTPGSVRGTPMPTSGPTQRGSNARDPPPKEFGLLHCGSSENNDDPFFLMIDFHARTFRAVDCRLAGMRPNMAEPRKLDLIIAKEGFVGDNGQQEEEEELFRLEAAPKHVAAFWVKYAMGDD